MTTMYDGGIDSVGQWWSSSPKRGGRRGFEWRSCERGRKGGEIRGTDCRLEEMMLLVATRIVPQLNNRLRGKHMKSKAELATNRLTKERRDIAITEGIKCKHFFLESDMKGPTLKLDNTGKAILTFAVWKKNHTDVQEIWKEYGKYYELIIGRQIQKGMDYWASYKTKKNEHDKIRELSKQLAIEKRRSATYKRHLEMIFEHIEEHNLNLSKRIQDIVPNVREVEANEKQNLK